MESQSKTIEGRTYTVTQYTALRALDVFELVSPVLAPAFAKLAGAGQEADIGPAIEALVARLGGGKLRQLANALLEPVQVTENNRIRNMLDGFDIAYAGRLGEVFQVLAFAVEVQFGSFFSGWVRSGVAPTAPASSSPSASAAAG
jgi:hypothetical protein